MVNPIKSAVQDYVTTTITHKILGSDKQKNQQQPQPQHTSSGIGGIFNQISSSISSALNPNQPQPQQQPSLMSGGGGGYGSGYPSGGGGGGGYGYQPQGGQPYAGYPPQSQPYPGYDYNQVPPSSNTGHNIGFNVDPSYGPPPVQQSYPPTSYGFGGGSAAAPYPPSSQSGGGYPSAEYQPQQPYPSSNSFSSGQNQQFGTGYGAGGSPYPPTGYPPLSQPSSYPGGAGAVSNPAFPPASQYGGGSGGYQPSAAPAPAAGMATPSIRPNPSFNAQHTAELLRKAMKGFGCDKGKVIQALVNCSNPQRQEVVRGFKQMYGKDLIKELKSELTGDFEDLIIALMEPPARYDASQLRRAMQGLGTKEHVLIEIMTTRSNAQIQQIKMAYQGMYGADLERDLIGETSGHFKRLLVALCSGARDESWQADPLRANQDAHRLYRAGEGRLGTDESLFNSILAAQNYAQLRLVFDEYQKVSGHSIDQAIYAEFSGDIRDGLIAIVKSIRNRPAYFAELLYNSMKGLGTRDNDLIRLVVSRSEIDLADIRNAYQRLYGTSLEQAIASDCSGAYKDGLIAIVKGFYH